MWSRRSLGLRAFLIALGAIALAWPATLGARVVVDETGRRVNVPDHPQRLVSLAPSITETLYALGLGDRLVGDTDYCDYPPEAKLKPHVGNLLNPSLEKIVSLKPDLVLGIAEANRIQTADQLERLGIPLYGLTDHTLQDTLGSIMHLGRVLDCDHAAVALDENLTRRILAVERRVAGEPRPKVLFVVWHQPLTTAGPHTFISDVIHDAGGVSISDDLQGDWPRLTLEAALDRDPDVILFPSHVELGPSLDELKRLPGWRDFRAVKQNRLYAVSESIIHPSPRLVDALEQVAAILHPEAMREYRALGKPSASLERLFAARVEELNTELTEAPRGHREGEEGTEGFSSGCFSSVHSVSLRDLCVEVFFWLRPRRAAELQGFNTNSPTWPDRIEAAP
jgi:iron complex transport system substrate-binding protein